MNTIKKIMLTFCTVILLTSVLALPTSASTQDKVHTFKWTYGQRYFDSPSTYKKANNSATYFSVRDHSMPVNGFYIKTTIGANSSIRNSSSSYFLITTYGGKTIKHNTKATGKYAGLRTYYPESHFSWGDVTLNWSEDYAEDGSARLNW